MKNNTNNTAASTAITFPQLVALLDDPRNQNADTFHEIWSTGKKVLTPEESAALWDAMKPYKGKVECWYGKAYAAAHPSKSADKKQPKAGPVTVSKAEPKAKHTVKAPDAQPKAEYKGKHEAQPKAEKAAEPKTAKAPKTSPKAKEPTQKELLANILLEMQAMHKDIKAMDKRISALEKKVG